MSDQQAAKPLAAAWISLAGHAALAVLKGTIGLASGSYALLADAARSVSDAAGSIAALVGFKSGKKNLFSGRGYGSQVATSMAAVLLLLIGYELASSAVMEIVRGDVANSGQSAVIAIIIALFVQEALFQADSRLSDSSSSRASLVGMRERLLSRCASIAALIGIGGAYFAGQMNMSALYVLDPLAGVIISLLVVFRGLGLMRAAVFRTQNEVQLNERDTAELIRMASILKGIVAVDEIKASEHGHYVVVEMTLSVDPNMTVMEGHELGKMVKYRIMEKYSHVADVIVHITPFHPGYPYNSDGDASKSYTSLVH